MELVVKLYSDKPSKIGIKYTQEYLAVRAYEDIFNKGAGDIFSLKMEMVKDKMSLTLISEETGIRILYKELDFKMEQLKKLEASLQPGTETHFVHVFSKTNTLMIAKPFRSQRFIKINACEIIGPASFSGSI